MHQNALKEAHDAVLAFHEKHGIPNKCGQPQIKTGYEYRLPLQEMQRIARGSLCDVLKDGELLPEKLEVWRTSLIVEEFCELLDELRTADKVKIAKEIADCIYVLIGMAIQFQIPIIKVFDAVQESNMSKEGSFSGKFKDLEYLPPNIQLCFEEFY